MSQFLEDRVVDVRDESMDQFDQLEEDFFAAGAPRDVYSEVPGIALESMREKTLDTKKHEKPEVPQLPLVSPRTELKGVARLPRVDFCTFTPLVGTKFFSCNVDMLDYLVETITKYVHDGSNNIHFEVKASDYSWVCTDSNSFSTSHFNISLFYDAEKSLIVTKFYRLSGCSHTFSNAVLRFTEFNDVAEHMNKLNPIDRAETSIMLEDGRNSARRGLPTIKVTDSYQCSVDDFITYCNTFAKWSEADAFESLQSIMRAMPKIWHDFAHFYNVCCNTEYHCQQSCNEMQLLAMRDSIVSLYNSLCSILTKCFHVLHTADHMPSPKKIALQNGYSSIYSSVTTDATESSNASVYGSLCSNFTEQSSPSESEMEEIEAEEYIHSGAAAVPVGVYRSIGMLDSLVHDQKFMKHAPAHTLGAPSGKSGVHHGKDNEIRRVSDEVTEIASRIAAVTADSSLSHVALEEVSCVLFLTLSCITYHLHADMKGVQNSPLTERATQIMKDLVKNVLCNNAEFKYAVNILPGILDSMVVSPSRKRNMNAFLESSTKISPVNKTETIAIPKPASLTRANTTLQSTEQEGNKIMNTCSEGCSNGSCLPYHHTKEIINFANLLIPMVN